MSLHRDRPHARRAPAGRFGGPGLAALLLLAACGYDAPLGPPSPPPQPSALLDQKAPGVVQRTGLLSDLSVATRSWVLTADGQRLTCHLAAAGTVSVDGHSAGLEEVPTDQLVTIEGVQRADLVVVDRVTVGVNAAGADGTKGADASGASGAGAAGGEGAGTSGAQGAGTSGADAASGTPAPTGTASGGAGSPGTPASGASGAAASGAPGASSAASPSVSPGGASSAAAGSASGGSPAPTPAPR